MKEASGQQPASSHQMFKAAKSNMSESGSGASASWALSWLMARPTPCLSAPRCPEPKDLPKLVPGFLIPRNCEIISVVLSHQSLICYTAIDNLGNLHTYHDNVLTWMRLGLGLIHPCLIGTYQELIQCLRREKKEEKEKRTEKGSEDGDKKWRLWKEGNSGWQKAENEQLTAWRIARQLTDFTSASN